MIETPEWFRDKSKFVTADMGEDKPEKLQFLVGVISGHWELLDEQLNNALFYYLSSFGEVRSKGSSFVIQMILGRLDKYRDKIDLLSDMNSLWFVKGSDTFENISSLTKLVGQAAEYRNNVVHACVREISEITHNRLNRKGFFLVPSEGKNSRLKEGLLNKAVRPKFVVRDLVTINEIIVALNYEVIALQDVIRNAPKQDRIGFWWEKEG